MPPKSTTAAKNSKRGKAQPSTRSKKVRVAKKAPDVKIEANDEFSGEEGSESEGEVAIAGDRDQQILVSIGLFVKTGPAEDGKKSPAKAPHAQAILTIDPSTGYGNFLHQVAFRVADKLCGTWEELNPQLTVQLPNSKTRFGIETELDGAQYDAFMEVMMQAATKSHLATGKLCIYPREDSTRDPALPASKISAANSSSEGKTLYGDDLEKVSIDRQLRKLWVCGASDCKRKDKVGLSFCIVHPFVSDDHIKLTGRHRRVWVEAILNKEPGVDLHTPPVRDPFPEKRSKAKTETSDIKPDVKRAAPTPIRCNGPGWCKEEGIELSSDGDNETQQQQAQAHTSQIKRSGSPYKGINRSVSPSKVRVDQSSNKEANDTSAGSAPLRVTKFGPLMSTAVWQQRYDVPAVVMERLAAKGLRNIISIASWVSVCTCSEVQTQAGITKADACQLAAAIYIWSQDHIAPVPAVSSFDSNESTMMQPPTNAPSTSLSITTGSTPSAQDCHSGLGSSSAQDSIPDEDKGDATVVS